MFFESSIVDTSFILTTCLISAECTVNVARVCPHQLPHEQTPVGLTLESSFPLCPETAPAPATGVPCVSVEGKLLPARSRYMSHRMNFDLRVQGLAPQSCALAQRKLASIRRGPQIPAALRWSMAARMVCRSSHTSAIRISMSGSHLAWSG